MRYVNGAIKLIKLLDFYIQLKLQLNLNVHVCHSIDIKLCDLIT